MCLLKRRKLQKLINASFFTYGITVLPGASLLFIYVRSLPRVMIGLLRQVSLKLKAPSNGHRILSTLTEKKRVGMELADVVDRLEAFAPSALAEAWDNVGLLLEPTSPR